MGDMDKSKGAEDKIDITTPNKTNKILPLISY